MFYHLVRGWRHTHYTSNRYACLKPFSDRHWLFLRQLLQHRFHRLNPRFHIIHHRTHAQAVGAFDAQTHRILGGGIVGTHAGDMIGEIALAIEMGADSVDIGKTIHPHPTLGESIGMAAEVAHGSCTDVPPQRK